MRMLPDKFLAAMIGVLSLPGAPKYAGSSKAVISNALADLDQYLKAGVDVIVLENSHDLPYIKPPLDPLGIVLIKRIAKEVRRRFDGPIGIQLLEAANEAALEIACEADLDFVRVEGYVFAHIGGAGLIEGCAGRLLRRRAELGGNHIKVFADVNKKHCSHALTADLELIDVVRQAEFFFVDGVIVTGPRTGESPKLKELRPLKESLGGRLHCRFGASGTGSVPRSARSSAAKGLRQGVSRSQGCRMAHLRRFGTWRLSPGYGFR
jgi:uncharacterized protein